MEQENQNAPVEHSEETSGNSESSKQDKVAYDSYMKALHEKKMAQGRQSELEAELQKLREEKLEREGKIEELNQTYKKERDTYKSELEQTKKMYAWNSLTNSIKAQAVKHNCVDTDLLIKAIDDEDLKRINMGEDFSIDTESLDSVIADTKKKRPHLFKPSSAPAVNGVPNAKISSPKKKELKDMSLDELREAYKKSYN